MYNYIFRKQNLSIEAAFETIAQLRQQFANQIDLWEFEWLNYELYISLRCTADTAHQIIISPLHVIQHDKWDIQYDD